jgi:hypothetical protein
MTDFKFDWDCNKIYRIRCLPGEYNIKVDPNVTPKVDPPGRIAHALKPKVKGEIDRMVSEKVIIKVEKPTVWVNPIVIVENPNGKARICLDPRDLNRGIFREHYPLKTIDEVAAKRCKSYQYS